jgi:tetratricopeptide (TPR) repeat protein
MFRTFLAVFLAMALCACGGATTRGTRSAERQTLAPNAITGSTYDSALRHFYSLDLDDPERSALREKMVAYLFGRCSDLVADNDYMKVVDVMAEVTSLYTVQEFSRGELPAQLEPLAKYLVEYGSPKGDEARVLSALLVLKLLHPDEPKYAHEYERLKGWSVNSREAIDDPLERYQGLITVWREHARLTPTPELLNMVARLYVERCLRLLERFRDEGSRNRFEYGMRIFQSVQVTSLEVAAVYLRYADIASALARIEALRTTGNVDERLVEALRGAQAGGENGASSMLDLAAVFLKAGRPEIALALCRSGLRERRTDPRFPQCLARIAATQDRFADAMAWYTEAVEMAPEEQRYYDETLEVLNQLIEQELFETNPTNTRQLAIHATRVLKERMRRWPESVPPVSPARLYLAIGIAEMNAGNIDEAEGRFRESLKAKENVEALLQLGQLLGRMGRGLQAAPLFQRALEVAPDKNASDTVKRAEILEQLGDAQRMSGSIEQSVQSYQRALGSWESAMPSLEGSAVGHAQTRRGILFGRLGKSDRVIECFKLAMKYAPESRETYAAILSYLLVSGSDVGFGSHVFRYALRQATLEPEWKVYFALWVRAIAARSGASVEADQGSVLDELSDGGQWWARLARFGASKIDFKQLMADAANVGERTEAFFYEATRRLGAGDIDGARQMLQQVLNTRMVSFYEYAMAQELLVSRKPLAARQSPTIK